MSAVSAVLLKAGTNVQPEAVMVDGLESIQLLVGGCIDAVRIDTQQINPDTGEEETPRFTIVGYVHDEGLMLDMEINWIASALFQQRIVGNVVLVSGNSPTGEYDGENHDIPDTLFKWLSTSFVKHVAKTYNESVMVAEILEYVKNDGGFTPAEVTLFTETMQKVIEEGASDDTDGADIIDSMLEKARQHMMDKVIARTVEKESNTLISEIDTFLEGEANK
jgi:hypothetical protein